VLTTRPPRLDIAGAAELIAQRARLAIQRTLRDCFERHELAGLLTPTLPVTAARKEQTAIDFGADDAESPEAAYVRLCVAFNLAGLPALSLPCGLDRRNLPIGLQIVGRPFADGTVLRIARAYERATAWRPLNERRRDARPRPYTRSRPPRRSRRALRVAAAHRPRPPAWHHQAWPPETH